uniref:G-protein coupled receptors family 1 profile domain-containing protein n=1 Tax=Periophthalmus magnuspinnatus TaxID=409849 RepID=A0A3B4A9P3_9GOBI
KASDRAVPPVTSNLSAGPLVASARPCSIDESYKYVFLPVCYSLTFVFSLTLNSVVLARSCRVRRRWTTSLTYMVNLASTDLMYGLSLPFLVHSYVLRDRWVFGDFMCRLVRFLFYFNLYCSIFFLTCISVHRYLGICHPMRTMSLESKRAVRLVCALVWVVVFALTCPIFRFAQTGLLSRAQSQDQGLNQDLDQDQGLNQGLDQDRTPAPQTSPRPNSSEPYLNCWDDAIDREFADYVPYGVLLHLLGFFVPFVVIAWCYSQVVRTIFRTLRSPPSSVEEGGASDVSRERTSVSIAESQYSHYIRRRRKSIKTIVTITLLFASKVGDCGAIRAVSICYKVTRPLASCNAWLNALLYFLTGDSAPCCCGRPAVRREGALWWPLTILKKDAMEEEPEEKMERQVHGEESKSSKIIF